MEQRQFDAVARALGGGLSRRGLGMLVGALAVSAPAGVDARKKKKKCQAGLTTCKVKKGKKKKVLCVDARTDPVHCGGCGQVCASGQSCVGGACVSSTPSPPPSPPVQPCSASTCANGCCDDSGVCRSGTSNAVCGKSGGACAACSGQGACVGGACVCQPTTCTAIGNVCGPQSDGCGGILTCTCSAGSFCQGNGTCQTCDVCANGCTHATIQAAVDAAPAGDTIRICAGTYNTGSGPIVTLGKNLTLIGAGTGLSGTRVFGNGIVRDAALVHITNGVTAELRNLEILGGAVAMNPNLGADIQNSGTLTLTRVWVMNGETVNGGGIWTDGTLILNDGASVINNFAEAKGGGIYQAGGTVTLNAGSSVTGNATSAAGGGGGIWSDGELNIDPGATLANNTSNFALNNCAGSGCP